MEFEAYAQADELKKREMGEICAKKRRKQVFRTLLYGLDEAKRLFKSGRKSIFDAIL
jgi:hypothetical protein